MEWWLGAFFGDTRSKPDIMWGPTLPKTCVYCRHPFVVVTLGRTGEILHSRMGALCS